MSGQLALSGQRLISQWLMTDMMAYILCIRRLEIRHRNTGSSGTSESNDANISVLVAKYRGLLMYTNL